MQAKAALFKDMMIMAQGQMALEMYLKGVRCSSSSRARGAIIDLIPGICVSVCVDCELLD